MDSKTWIELSDGTPVTNAEKFAMQIENKIRSEHGVPLRTHYTKDHGRLVGPATRLGTRMSANYFTKLKANSFGNQKKRIPLFPPTIYVPYVYKEN